MPAESKKQFLDLVVESGLVSKADLETMNAGMANEATTEHDVAAKLVEQDFLTEYQTRQILAGHGQECILAERYHVLDELGSGAMGVVYRARDTRLGRDVAIKVLPARSLNDADAIVRFKREAKALAQFSHPNIIQAYDSGHDQGRHFLVMEFVDGMNLANLLRDKGRIAPARAADFVYQAALGLQHAHEKGLVHRDLKPSNLVLTQEQQIKILDLGLARFLQDQVGDETLTQEGIGMGTPDYMSPEQFRDARNVDARSDVYSLGCTLYQLLAGQVPFPGSSLSEKYTAHEKQEPPSLAEKCSDVPTGLAMVVERMMEKRPVDRFQTPREVSEALAPNVAGSSMSVTVIRETASWHGSQLGISVVSPRSRSKKLPIAVGALAAITLVVLAVFLVPKFFGNGETSSGAGQGKSLNTRSSTLPVQPQPNDPNVLTVAQDGTGQFRTINEALAKVKPGMTIRVLDKQTYTEAISISRPSAHQGITLEATNGAIIAPSNTNFAVQIRAVSNVTLRGFRLRAEEGVSLLVNVSQDSSGLRLDQIQMDSRGLTNRIAIRVEQLGLSDEDVAVTIENCEFRNFQIGIQIMAVFDDYQSPSLVSRVFVRNNLMLDVAQGIIATGLLQEIQIVGNRFLGSSLYGVQLENLLRDSRDILVANNSFFECSGSLRVWDKGVGGENIRIVNNLILSPNGPDMLFFDSGGSKNTPIGPGDFKTLYEKWQFNDNWRETSRPQGRTPFDVFWIPPGESDVMSDEINVLSTDSTDPDFLRPALESPLATNGAGKQNSAFPTYVGAVPPNGVELWDWDKTWKDKWERPRPIEFLY